MEPSVAIAVGVGLAVIGLLIAVLVVLRRRSGGEPLPAEEQVGVARVEAQRILGRAEDEGRAKAEAYREREEAQVEHRRVELSASEERLVQREHTLEQRAANLAQREQLLIHRESEVSELGAEAERLKEDARPTWNGSPRSTLMQQRKSCCKSVRDEARREAMLLVRDTELRAREEADRRAKRILTTAIQRLASEVVTESTVSVVELPGDDMKAGSSAERAATFGPSRPSPA